MTLDFSLLSGLRIDDLLPLASAAAALLVLFAVWLGLVERDPFAGRLRALAERRAAFKAGMQTPRGNRARGNLRESGLSFMRRFVMRLNLLRGRHTERVSWQLARAGLRSKDALIVYLFAKAALPFIAAGAAALWFELVSKDPGLRLLAICVGFLAGLYASDLYIKNLASKRTGKLRKGLPDALDLLVICAEAGLSLDAAMTRVGREMGGASLELADEFSLTALELGFLPNRQQALQNLARRTDMAELRALINSLTQTERYGTPLAHSLRVLAAEFRDERLLRAEEKAAKLPAIMTVPMITFILPALFIVLGGPAVINVMDTLSKM